MRTLFGVLLFVCFFSIQASAQDSFPKGELFGGYSYFSVDGGGVVNRQGLNGFAVGGTGNINRSFGVTGQVVGAFGSIGLTEFVDGIPVTASGDSKVFGLFVGPEFSSRTSRGKLFFHPLVGLLNKKISNLSGTALGITVSFPGLEESESTIAWDIGGGYDINVGENLAVRLFQADYIGEKTSPVSHHFRISAGLVVRFGN